MKKINLPEVEPVKLKPLFGIKPGIWLFSLYSLIIFAVFFSITLLPDFIHGYKRVSFNNSTGISAVYVDGYYRGGTPCTVKIDSGNHNVEYKISDITVDSFSLHVGHPVFLNWLWPRKMTVNRNAIITEDVSVGLARSFFQDVFSYSSILEYDKIYRYPPLFTNYAKSVKNLNFQKDYLNYALQFITTKEMLDDAKEAYDILGLEYDFSNLEKAIKNKSFRKESKHLSETIDGKARLIVNNFTVSGYKYGTDENAFNIAETPVTETMYAYFIKENPKWSKENKDKLLEAKLVDDFYLSGVTLSTEKNSNKAITNISYYAAKAFCDWASEVSGKDVFLPTEEEWTAVSDSADRTFFRTTTINSDNKTRPVGMFGGVWEFTSTYYVPNDNIISSDIQKFLNINGFVLDPVVKGGCFLNKQTDVNSYTIGFVSPFTCTDTYGFRIAWK